MEVRRNTTKEKVLDDGYSFVDYTMKRVMYQESSVHSAFCVVMT